MATSNANGTRLGLNNVRYRKNIRHLTPQELNDLRHAFEGLYAISQTTSNGTVDPAGNPDDERGYQWIAGVHGAPPPVYCQHGTIHFTTWHRAYLYRFEKLLQDQVPTVMLPWWDWADEDSLAEGLPAAVTAPTYEDLDSGDTKPNPLFSAFSQATGQTTTRNPRPIAQLQTIKTALDFAMEQIEYANFVNDLENPHGLVHVWVGGGSGDMGSVPTAAYDPVFWLHHGNVDRYWSMWQQEHPNAVIPPEALSFVAAPFNMTGQSVMRIDALGYAYATDETMVSAVDVRAAAEVLGEPERQADEAPRPNVTFELDPVPRRYRRATLEFVSLKPPVDSYLVHIFLNNPDATLDTPQTTAEGYAGILTLFGHGACLGGPGHCDVTEPVDTFDRRPRHHKAPNNAHVDVSWPLADVVRRDTSGDPRVPVSATLVVENAAGELADPSVLHFEAISLVTRA